MDDRKDQTTVAIPSAEMSIRSKQRLRLRRFGMALLTYAALMVAATLATRLGIGNLNPSQWAVFIGLAVIGNIVFFILFSTGLNLRFADPSLTQEQIVYSACWGMMPMYWLPGARPIILMLFLPAFSFGMLRLSRRQYFRVIGIVLGLYALLLGLEVYRQRPGFNIQFELFLYVIFSILLFWYALFGVYMSNLRHRLRKQSIIIQKSHEEMKVEINERKQAQIEKEKTIIELQSALNEVKTLSGLLPICSTCKKIRDDRGYWKQIESYIRDHSTAEFSHSICPACAQKLYPGLYGNTSEK